MIRVFDLNLDLLDEIDGYDYLMFTRDLYSHGEFSLKMNAKKPKVEYLQKDNIIVVGKELNRCGIIKAVERQADESETIEVKGYTLDFIFTQRLILPVAPSAFDSITAAGETAIKHYLANCVTAPVDPDRTIDLFNLVADAAQGTVSEYNARYNLLNEFLTAIRKEQQMGISCTLNIFTKKIDVDVVVGQDHTAGTSSPVIFSTDYDNLLSQTYYESSIEERNFAYVGGEGEGASRDVDTFGSDVGLDRKELFVDTSLPLASLPAAGSTELAQYPEIITFEGEIINRLPFIYGQDFDLGDLVTITNKRWGVTLNTRIVSVTEIYEPEGFQLEIAFGNNIPTLVDVVDKKTKKEVR